MMKKIVVALLVCIAAAPVYSEDTIKMPKLMLRPYVENGIDFIRNDGLKEYYKTQSKYFAGFGLQYGHPLKNRIIPLSQISYSKCKIDNTADYAYDMNNTDQLPGGLIVPPSSEFTTIQWSAGLLFPFKLNDKSFLRAQAMYSYAMIDDSYGGTPYTTYDKNSMNSHGFQIGFGAERLIGLSRAFAEIRYNYQKSISTKFQDYDMVKFAFGFVL